MSIEVDGNLTLMELDLGSGFLAHVVTKQRSCIQLLIHLLTKFAFYCFGSEK